LAKNFRDPGETEHVIRVGCVVILLAFGCTTTPPDGARPIPPSAEEAVAPRPIGVCRHGPRTHCVVDGDTLWLGGEKIRIADVEAPETSRPACPAERARGVRARDRLVEWINEAPFEVERAGARDRDRYDRLLRILTRDGRSFGETLFEEDLARPWTGKRRPWPECFTNPTGQP